MNFLFEFGSISYFYTVFYGVTCERIVVSRKRKRERNREYSFFRLYFSLISNFFVCSGVSCLTLLFVWESGTLSGIVNNWWFWSVSGCGYVRVRNKSKKKHDLVMIYWDELQMELQQNAHNNGNEWKKMQTKQDMWRKTQTPRIMYMAHLWTHLQATFLEY